MSEGEMFLGVIGLAAAVMLWARWFKAMLSATRLGRGSNSSRLLVLMPVLCAVVLALLLRRFADAVVRSNVLWIVFYTVLGLAWVGAGEKVVRVLGYSARDDVAERRNGAAALTIAGAMIGFTFAFSGANFGDGPGWWVVLYCAALSSGALILMWAVLESVAHLHELVTIDRHVPTGLRLGAFLAASGAVLGRAVAGDWTGIDAALYDFITMGWPVLIILAVELGVAKTVQPRDYRAGDHLMLGGVIPAAFYLVAAAFYIHRVGAW